MAVLKWIGLGLLGLAGLVVVGGGLALALFDWNDARGFAARQASKALGREVAIDGTLDVKLGDPIHIHIEGLRVANTDWAKEPNFAEVRVLDAQVRLWPLLRGDIEVPEVKVSGPKLAMEKNAEGANNWTFGNDPRKEAAEETVKPDDRSEVPLIESLVIEDGRVGYLDPKSEIDINSTINTATGGSGDASVRLDGQGSFAGKPFKLAVDGGSLLFLRDTAQPYPIKVEASVGKTRGKVEGKIAEPVKLEGVDLSIEVAGDDMAEIFPIFGIPTPKTRPYALSGRLGKEGNVWRFDGMNGKVGESDLAGNLAMDTGGERPRITADLTSRRLAAVDLAGFVGASPRGSGDYPTKGPGRILPATEVNLERLRFADMDVRFKGQRVEAPMAPLDGLDAHLKLENGKATLEPLSVGIGKGRVAGTVVLDGQGRSAALRTNLEVRGVQLAQFFRDTPFAKEMGGTVSGRVQLTGRGPTVADILAAADGKVGLAVDGGRISALAVKGLKTNVLETLGVVLSGDRPLPFNCLVTDVEAQNGVAKVNALVLDTPETLITGQGGVNLKEERLNMRVQGKAKHPQIFATHVPVTVGGTLGDPDIGVDATETAARGAAAVALGVLLTPLASILPLVDTGTDEEAHCGSLIQNAKAPAGPAGKAGNGKDTNTGRSGNGTRQPSGSGR
ncbi:AsmA family protein [Azospirillum sp.]|uniref:AsmA family protein n=1 Tax=Azospirillum sp. TaxID=34012 RepID=UPI002D752B5D|nr:AsmA family protein [Azospirillum sp.]HYD64912.1 AsmA family protein [Azospirillum sp.]